MSKIIWFDNEAIHTSNENFEEHGYAHNIYLLITRTELIKCLIS